MRRSSVLNSKAQDDIFGSFSTSLNHKDFDDENSSYLHDNSNSSDNESFSDSSRKIRKKRNTYQKISDDIRMQLLEAVQNGETLKAAAKRHKINYSSAKSILHTYRKEGRILKKSAQERSTKKKNSSDSDFEQPTKPSKFSKKENLQPSEDSSKTYRLSSFEKSKSDNYADVSAPFGMETSSLGNLKIDNCEHHYEDNSDIKPLGEVQMLHNNHAIQKTEESIKRGYDTHMDNVQNRQVLREEPSAHRAKLFENFQMNYFDASYEPKHNHMYGDVNDFSGYAQFPNQMDSFNDMMSTWQNRSGQNDDIHRNATEIGEPTGENMGFPFMNFMDSQRMLQKTSIRKASFVSYGGSSNGFRRKESFDLFQ